MSEDFGWGVKRRKDSKSVSKHNTGPQQASSRPHSLSVTTSANMARRFQLSLLRNEIHSNESVSRKALI